MLTLFVAMLCAGAVHAETYRLPLFVDETTSGQTGVLRIDNESDTSATLSIYAIDDSGDRSGPATLTLAAAAAVEIEADELESGNAAIGLSGGIGTISGDVRLEFVTDLTINALAYLRTGDGTLAVLHDEVAGRTTASGGYEYQVPIFNPASNMAQASSLRLINSNGTAAMVSISGLDDAGTATGSVTLMLNAGGARTLTAQQIESGSTGLTGQFGAGTGRWRLTVTSDEPIEVVNLVTSSTGRLDNLSSAGKDGLAPVGHGVFNERFSGEVIATESERQSTELSIQASNRFSETVTTDDASSSTRSGDYAYRRARRDVGELTLNYSQGDPCVTNLHFDSHSHGWFASRCGEAEDQEPRWRGGSWVVAEDDAPIIPQPSGLRFATSDGPGDQNFTLNQAIQALILPIASGGAGAVTYSLTPTVAGLSFDTAMRRLTGTPTEVGTTSVTYTATDEAGDTDSFRFLIVVRDAGSEDCLLGLIVRPGESCNYPGTANAFTVNQDGSASFLIINSTRAINLPNRTYQGQVYDFRASHQGDGIWRIDRLEGVEAPPPDTTPRIPEADAPSDQTYMAGEAITRLTLAAATQGEGALTYNLTPDVPGLSFDPATRQLTGTPTEAGSYQMIYRVTDEDGDSSSVAFTITVEEAEPPPPEEEGPDLIVVSPLVSEDTLTTAQTFRFSATVRNQGDSASDSTRLGYYRSSDSTISTSDTQVGSDNVNRLAASESAGESERLPTPSTAGTYYYGACVVSVQNESDTTNNCSSGVRVSVTAADAPIEGAELIVESPTASDTSLSPRQLFTLRVTVRNRGTETTPSTRMNFYRSSDATISTGDTRVDSSDVQSLAASGSSVESVRIAAPSASGSYYFGACVQAVANEVNTNNNCSTAVRVQVSGGSTTNPGGGNTDPPIPSTTPDLAVESPSVSVSSGDAGFSFDLTVRVRNRGNTNAQPSPLLFLQSTDSQISENDTIVGQDNVALLAANSSAEFTLTGQTAPVNSGTYYYGACVYVVVNEQNVDNNCSSGVRIRVQFDGPDLLVDAVSVSSSSPSPGQEITLRARVRNSGNQAAGAGTLTYYRSDDAAIDTSDTVVGTSDEISALSASGSENENTTVTAPDAIGVYYYGACVSGHGTDTNSLNDCSAGVRVTIPGADLVVLSPSVSDSTPAPEERITFSARVRNTGVDESSGTTLIYYLSYDSSITGAGAGNDLEVGTDSVGGLRAGESDEETINLTAPETWGTYYYGACVTSVGNEDDTMNNCSTAVRITVSAPDLVVVSPRVDNATPDAGERFRLSVRVGNSGGVPAAPTRLRYYLSDDAEITTADTELVGTLDSVGGLDATETSTESTSVTAEEVPGEYYYGACVESVADESDITNNCSTAVLVTVPAPDLVVDSARVDNFRPQAGERFDLMARVRNRGQAEAEATTLTYYRSDDDTIDASDVVQGTDRVRSLDPSESDEESIRVTAPATPGTYYYGACVAVHAHESDDANNCSNAVRVIVPAPDLTVVSPRVDDSTVAVGESFELSVVVRNRGAGVSGTASLTYYESDDRDIDPQDNDVALGSATQIGELDPSESASESADITPTTAGTYYYGACVSVTDDSNADNDCSDGVRVTVSQP